MFRVIGPFISKAVIIVGITMAVVAWNRPDLVTSLFPPCRAPITYSLGSFDERFGITETEFLSAVSQAETLWEDALGKELFTFVLEKGKMSVNLAYDERQETTQELEELGQTVGARETAYRSLHSRFETAKAQYDASVKMYDARIASFNAKNDVYAARVDAWNAGPRTSQSELNAIENERRALETEVASLKQQEAVLNRAADELNALVDSLNRSAKVLNGEVSRYNAVGASRGDTFTGGTYSESGRERRIDIYEFSSRAKLVRILAHELGHALGLDHSDEHDSVMYHLNEGESVRLSESDVSALRTLCQAD